MNISPTSDNVLARFERIDVTRGGIIIPEIAKKRHRTGVIMDVGPKVKEITGGEIVFLGKYEGIQIDPNDETLIMIKEEDIVARMGAEDEFIPILNRVMIRLETADAMTAGGIIVPECAQKRKHVGKVLAVGPKVEEVSAGDNILLDDFPGLLLDPERDPWLMMIRSDDIVAVF